MAAPMYARLETDLSDTEDFEHLASLPAANLFVLAAAVVGLVMIAWAAHPLIENGRMGRPSVAAPYLVLSNLMMTIIMTVVEMWPIVAIIILNIAFPLVLIGLYRLYRKIEDNHQSERLPWGEFGRAIAPFGIGVGLLFVPFFI